MDCTSNTLLCVSFVEVANEVIIHCIEEVYFNAVVVVQLIGVPLSKIYKAENIARQCIRVYNAITPILCIQMIWLSSYRIDFIGYTYVLLLDLRRGHMPSTHPSLK